MEKEQETNEVFNQICESQSQICMIEGTSGCGKTETFLNHIHTLIEQGESIKKCLNFVSSQDKVKSTMIRYQQKFENDEIVPSFTTLVGFCYNLIKKVNAQQGKETWKVYKDLHVIVDQLCKKHFDVELTNEESITFMSTIAKVKTTFASENEIQKIKLFDGSIDFSYIYKQYEKEKNRCKVLDFEDCLVQAFQLLSNAKIKEEIGNFNWIHVDDAQELSFIAHCILKQLSNEETRLHFYYDKHQTLNLRHAADLQPLEHLATSSPSVSSFVLNKNYRNGKAILELANQFYFKEANHIQAMKEDEGTCMYKGFASTLDLNEYALQKAKASEGKIAFLTRNFEMLVPFMDLLETEEMSYQCRKGQAFFKHPIVNDMMYFFALLRDPRNLNAFIEVMPKMKCKIGDKALAQIAQELQADSSVDIYQIIINSNLKSEIKNRVRLLIEQLREVQYKTSIDCFTFVLETLQYKKFLYEQSISLSHPVMVALQTLVDRYPNPSVFVQRLQELSSANIPAHARIVLATVEEVQGQQFDEVFLLDMQSNHFPYKEGEMERQALYSAMTKAQDHLEFLFAKSAGLTRLRPSPYLIELFKKNEKEKEEPQEKPTPKVPRKGKKILHTKLGEGTIIALDRHMAKVRFAQKNERTINLTFCLENGLATLLN